MLIDSGRSDIAWLDAELGRSVGRREIEEPVLEKDVGWGGIHTDTR